MNKKKKTILIIGGILAAAAVIITVFVLKGRIYKADNIPDNSVPGLSVNSDEIVTRPKTEIPVSQISVIYDNYGKNSEAELSAIEKLGFNSVILNIDSKTDKKDIEIAANLIKYSKQNNIYCGVRINLPDSSVIPFISSNNPDFIILNGYSDTDSNLKNKIKNTFSVLKKIDYDLKIGYEPTSIDVIDKNVSGLISENTVDFIFLMDNGKPEILKSAQTVWDDAATEIWMCHSLKNSKTNSADSAKQFIDSMSSSSEMAQCKALCIDDYNEIIGLKDAPGQIIKEFVLKRETYLIDKTFSLTNYKNNNIKTYSSTINFMGTSSPVYDLMCNGQKIETAENGDFSFDYGLSPGDNKIVFEHKNERYTYNVNYEVKLLKSVSPDTSITLPAGLSVEITALAHKDAVVTAEFNGRSYQMIRLYDEPADESSGGTIDNDFCTYSVIIDTPSDISEEKSLGKFKVNATYNGYAESQAGAGVTITPMQLFPEIEVPGNNDNNDYSADDNTNITDETEPVTASNNESSESAAFGNTRRARTTVSRTRANTRTTVTRNTNRRETQTDISETGSANTNDDRLQQYSYTSNYGLGTAKICLITDDYVETYSGSNTSSKSVPDCSPLLKGTADYVTGSGVCADENSEKVYYYLSSGVKVPLYRTENSQSGPNTRINQLKIIDGYRMPSNNIRIISSECTGNKTVIKLEMNRLVAVNSKLIGQSYNDYNGRKVAVSKPDCTGIQFRFSDTSGISGKMSFMNSVIKSADFGIDNNSAIINFRFTGAGKFYGYHCEYSDGIFTITFKSKPNNLSEYTIVLDPGHGGYDSGASCAVSSSNWSEKKINLSIALKIKEILESYGTKVIMTRSDDRFLSLSARNAVARRYNPDLFISVHCDSSSASSSYGTSAYYYRAYSQPLAKYIHQALVSTYRNMIYYGKEKKNIDRGTNFYAFKVARVEECPAVLIEYGFVSNTGECQYLQNASTREILAKATVNGINNYIVNS